MANLADEFSFLVDHDLAASGEGALVSRLRVEFPKHSFGIAFLSLFSGPCLASRHRLTEIRAGTLLAQPNTLLSDLGLHGGV